MSLSSTSETFRRPRSGLLFQWIVGAAVLAGGVAIALLGRRAPGGEIVGYGVGGVMGLLGVLLCAAAYVRSRQQVTIGREGIVFKRDGELVPWSAIGSYAFANSNGTLRMVNAEGQVLGRVPVAFTGFGRALLQIADRVSGSPSGPAPVHVGRQGLFVWYGWLAPILGALLTIWQAVDSGKIGWFLAIPVIIVAWSLYRAPREARRMRKVRATIDREGIRCEGGEESWSLRWNEIELLVPMFSGGHPLGFAIAVLSHDGRDLLLPLAGMEIPAVLESLRSYGGETWKAMVARENRELPVALEHYEVPVDTSGYEEIPGDQFVRDLLSPDRDAEEDARGPST